MIDTVTKKEEEKSGYIKISPNFCIRDYQSLNLNTNNAKDWEKAIEIFKDRIEGRYLKQIEVMDLNPNRKIGTYAGFSIMSIVCLLIETLEQFWNGNLETSRDIVNTEICKYTSGTFAYHSFFQRNIVLSQFFNTTEKAEIFYSKIRCGLLHQGQTKGKSLIHIRKDEPILSWINPKNIEDGLSINRQKFVIEIKAVYKDYLEYISNAQLNERKKIFKKKMDYIIMRK